jgi:hypothetical protein
MLSHTGKALEHGAVACATVRWRFLTVDKFPITLKTASMSEMAWFRQRIAADPPSQPAGG